MRSRPASNPLSWHYDYRRMTGAVIRTVLKMSWVSKGSCTSIKNWSVIRMPLQQPQRRLNWFHTAWRSRSLLDSSNRYSMTTFIQLFYLWRRLVIQNQVVSSGTWRHRVSILWPVRTPKASRDFGDRPLAIQHPNSINLNFSQDDLSIFVPCPVNPFQLL